MSDFPSSNQQRTGSDVTAVVCVESGILEAMTVRLVESLRRFGGRFADCPVVAVTPRFGPALRSSTLRAFSEMGVRHLTRRMVPRYAWYHFLNKPLSLVAAEEVATTDRLVWLDADLLIVGEPSAWALSDSVDFGGTSPDNDILGSSGPDDPCEPCWQEVGRILGIAPERLGWITTHVDQRRIRLYWQGGMFVYRAGKRFAQEYLDACVKLLDAGVVFYNGAHWLEQMALSFVTTALCLRTIELPWSHNYAVTSYLREQFRPDVFAAARIVHYHDSMLPHFHDRFLEYLRTGHPDVFEWAAAKGPVRNGATPAARMMASALRLGRSFPRRLHRRASRVIPVAPPTHGAASPAPGLSPAEAVGSAIS